MSDDHVNRWDYPCDSTQLGLTDGHLASLTGFTRRAVAVLAHLRESWLIADDSNRPGIEAALLAVAGTRSLKDTPALCRAVLSAGCGTDQHRRLLRAAGLL